MITNLLKDVKKAGFCMCMFAGASLSAFTVEAAEPVNLGELQNGVPVAYPANYDEVSATFTVQETGKVRIVCTGTFLQAYVDAAHTQTMDSEFSYMDGKPMREYNCEKGEIMYLYNGFVMDAGEVTVFNGEQKLELIQTSPSTNPESSDYYGGAYSISADYIVQFTFNMPVEVEGARMTINGTTTQLSADGGTGTTSIDVNVAETLMNMYKAATVRAGDTMTLELYGVHEKNNADNKVNGTGIASVEFVMAARPIELVSTKNTPDSGSPDMLSYYLPGNPAALVQLTFSGDVSTEHTPIATLEYGDLDNIDAGMYVETLEGSVSGTTVTFDLAGKLRRPQDMVPLLTSPTDYISMTISGICSKDGQRAFTGHVANPNNFIYTYKLSVLQYNIASDFTPSESKGLEQGKELEIFIMDGDKLSYDGVKFEYTAAGSPAEVVVPKDKLDISMEGATDVVILLNVPELPGIDAESEVTVTLDNMLCADGLDHTNNVKAVYKQFTVGIEGIAAEGKSLDIYNAQGVLVMKAAGEIDMKSLPAGLYITRGRKVVVK